MEKMYKLYQEKSIDLSQINLYNKYIRNTNGNEILTGMWEVKDEEEIS